MELAKRPDFTEYEPRIAEWWVKSNFYQARIEWSQEPYTILLPPPNANAPLHAGHALYVVEDILCRYHRMKGDPTLFLPGTDHAGIETQYVFEQKLNEQGKSRFDFDRQTLYQMIHAFVEENRGVATDQLRRLGFSLDWSRERYTLDSEILNIVYETFRKLHDDKLIFREERLVNYCTHCGTSFSNLEIKYIDEKSPLYYMKYGPFTLATTRPETKFGDTAVAVNPNDDRYSAWVNEEIVYESLVGPRTMRVIADEAVDPKFGTGVVKVTPAHDHNDFEIAQRHHLDFVKVVNREGVLTEVAGEYAGQSVKEARAAVVEALTKRGDIVKVDEDYEHRIAVCYRCNNVIEPLLLPQWFVQVEPMVNLTLQAIEEKKVQLYPPRFKQELSRWLETAPDWNISRQIVWGPQIPAWYCLDCNPQIELVFLNEEKNPTQGHYPDLKDQYEFNTIKNGLQTLVAPVDASYQLKDGKCPGCGGEHLLQETDTFDTWFSSGQWPLTTLGYPDHDDFRYFYPTSVLDTMWDILPFWVMRMLMLGLYRTGKVPYKWVHLHSRVVDGKGQKMSKSRGNVINPIDLVNAYGADVLRFALVFGVGPASDIPLGDEKMVGGRNFVTKIWNIARFIQMQNQETPLEEYNPYQEAAEITHPADRAIVEKLNAVIAGMEEDLEKYQFAQALDKIYDFTWNEFASKYVEDFKQRSDQHQSKILLNLVFINILKLVHPFMPFVTEELYRHFPWQENPSISLAQWPNPLNV